MKQKQRVALLGIAAVALIFAALALVACDSGSSSDPGAAESSSSAAAQSSDSSSSGMESSSGVAAQSSSAVTVSSSSAAKSSSSVAASSSGAVSSSSQGIVDPWTVVTGTMTDSRDGQSYKTVTIGTQTWMAENLNYAVEYSYCYNDSAYNCTKYGRLYQWAAAMNLDTSYLTIPASAVIRTPQQGACPAGWHVPTDEEWGTLENAVGGEDTAGTKLKSTSGWDHDGNGTDAYGFSALPAGGRYMDGFFNVASQAHFWSATEYESSNDAYSRFMESVAAIYTDDSYKYLAFSVRCVKD